MFVAMRSASFRAALTVALTTVAAPCAAHEAQSAFLPVGGYIDAPRGFVEMCRQTKDFCSATPAKADNSMVTAALADTRSMSSGPASGPVETPVVGSAPILAPVPAPVFVAERSMEPQRVTFQVRSLSCGPISAVSDGPFSSIWASLDIFAAGRFARPVATFTAPNTCSLGSTRFTTAANGNDEKRTVPWNACETSGIAMVRSRMDPWRPAVDDRLMTTPAALRPFWGMDGARVACSMAPGAAIFTAPAPDPVVAVVPPKRDLAMPVPMPMPVDPMKLLQSVNRYVNGRVRQRTDFDIYGRDEFWVRSGVGRGASGDCEDIAIEKRYELIARGFPPGRLSFAVVYSTASGLHTVLIAHDDDGDVVLDSRTPYIRRWSAVGYSWVSVQSTGDPMIWRRLT